MCYHEECSWGAWLSMSVVLVAFSAVLIWAIFTVVRSTAPGAPRGETTPEQILAERFARGEIDEEDYGRRLDALRTVDRRNMVGRGVRS